MAKRIYVASSWSTACHYEIVEMLREKGFEVYDYRNPEGRTEKNIWDDLEVNKQAVFSSAMPYLMGMEETRARFKEHHEQMLKCDACILLLPSGRSAHGEACYMQGLGKKVWVFTKWEDQIKPELIYRIFGDNSFFNQYTELSKALDDFKEE